jgi:hypothetical protein
MDDYSNIHSSTIDISEINKESFRYPSYIVNYLIDKYNHNKYPNSKQIEEIAARTQLHNKQIYAWFQERRVKFNHTKPARFSTHIDYLIDNYNRDKYPSAENIKKMSEMTHMTEKQIYTWFQERRVKLKHTKPTRFSQRSINYLIEKYNQNIYPNGEEIKLMSQFTKLTEVIFFCSKFFVFFLNYFLFVVLETSVYLVSGKKS